MKEQLTFPDLICIEDFNGDFKTYFEYIYSIFETDFIKNKPLYNGMLVNTQRYPEKDGMHRTFYHITHEGEIENEREPDLRRMERIRFPKFCIEYSTHKDFLIWIKDIKSDKRVHILNEKERYIVVLTERKNYYLFWTAFYIEHNHTLRKKIKEYEAYIKTKTA